MKKLIALLLALTMVLCMFAGCGEEKDPQTTDAPDSSDNQDPADTDVKKGDFSANVNVDRASDFYNIVESWKSIEYQKARAKSPEHLLLCHDKTMLDRVKKTPVIGVAK